MVEGDEPERIWTLVEANDALGRISERVRVAMEATGTQTVMDIAAELAAEGVLLRDRSTGLIDFASRCGHGRPYWLCWMWGEPEIDTWHWVEDGFAGRTSVDELPS